ncbi:putative aspartate aminotransferase [Trypoxylus dichotomus]
MYPKHVVLNSCKYFQRFDRKMSAWGDVKMGPADPILGVSEAFRACKSPKKVNLGIGAYRDENNKPYVLPCVEKAEKILHGMTLNKEYLPQGGLADFCKHAAYFAFGDDAEIIKNGSLISMQSLSGSGALKLGLELLKRHYNGPKVVYVSSPTWGNHIQMSKFAYLDVKTYKYYEPKTCSLDFKGFLDDINKMPEKSIIIFHVCAHNPTGVDPSPSQWDEISAACKKKQILPFFDMAYQGFASGDADNDAYSLRKFVKDGHLVMLAQSFAKNMGLYGERIGGFHVLTENKEQSKKVLSQLKIIVRSIYSNPPLSGARLVLKVLEDPVLKNDWRKEFKQMADRMKGVRAALKNNLKKEGSTKNWDHITNQIGMFCFSGLTPEQFTPSNKNMFLAQNKHILA